MYARIHSRVLDLRVYCKDVHKYSQLMMSLVTNGKRADVLQYTLVMLPDLLKGISISLSLCVAGY